MQTRTKTRTYLWLAVFSGVVLAGCFSAGKKNTAEKSETEVNEEARAAKCKQEREGLKQLDAMTAEFAKPVKKTELADEPYLKGKVLVLDARDSGAYRSRDESNCRASSECERDDSHCSRGVNFDRLSEVRARSAEEAQTIALVSCRKTPSGYYSEIAGDPNKKTPSFDQVCEVILIDRSIPAVIYKKTFKSESRSVLTGQPLPNEKEIVASVPTEDIDAFLNKLPRKP